MSLHEEIAKLVEEHTGCNEGEGSETAKAILESEVLSQYIEMTRAHAVQDWIPPLHDLAAAWQRMAQEHFIGSLDAFRKGDEERGNAFQIAASQLSRRAADLYGVLNNSQPTQEWVQEKVGETDEEGSGTAV